MKDPDEVLADSNRTWEEEKERLEGIKEEPSKLDRLLGRKKADRLFYILFVDILQEELEQKNIAKASYLLGQLYQLTASDKEFFNEE